MPNWDALGMMPKKAPPRLATVSLDFFDDAVQLLGRYLKERGYDIASVELEPYTERWMFYEHQTERYADTCFVTAVPHEVVEMLAGKLASRLVKPTTLQVTEA